MAPSSPGKGGFRVPLDSEGFARIHSEYGDRLVESITGFVRDRVQAEEIVARTFQAAWEKRDGFRGEASPYTWLQAIARNEARQSWKREQSHKFEYLDRSDAPELAAPEMVTDGLERRDDRLRIVKALEQVPDKFRRPLAAHFVDGRSIREIARQEGVPLGTVLSRISKGKQLLREAWDGSLTGPRPESPAAGAASAHSTGSRPPNSREPMTWGR